MFLFEEVWAREGKHIYHVRAGSYHPWPWALVRPVDAEATYWIMLNTFPGQETQTSSESVHPRPLQAYETALFPILEKMLFGLVSKTKETFVICTFALWIQQRQTWKNNENMHSVIIWWTLYSFKSFLIWLWGAKISGLGGGFVIILTFI